VGQSLDDINSGRWDLIAEQLRSEAESKGKSGSTTTSDFNALRRIAESTDKDIWISFHKDKLWWARLASGPVEQDSVSKFRRTLEPWSDCSADKRRKLLISNLSGKLSQTRGFRATVCKVHEREVLQRTLSGSRSALATAIQDHRATLTQDLELAIKDLHWQDFETLVDLVFRGAGWARVSVLGQFDSADLVLKESVTGYRYVVQVKSRAGLAEVQETVANFSNEDIQKIFFIVHTPDEDLELAQGISKVEIVGPSRLGELALDAGLAEWLRDKVS